MQSGEFLQSNEWEKFQQSLGRKTFRTEGALIIKMPFAFGFSFLYSPKNITMLTNEIKKIAKKEKAVFYRCEPQTAPLKNFIKTKNIQPACTQILDLSKPETELLVDMKQKTRYNVRLAEKKKVEIKEIQNTDTLYELLKQTEIRQEIKFHSKEYYKKLAEFNKIFIAYYDNEPIAGAMINFHNKTATYLHGGSSQTYKEVMGTYLLHWEIIKYAKNKKMEYYDWWGIDEKRWPGITKFKQGFGGKTLCAPGTFDFPFNKIIYKIYRYVRK